jgi:uncharacterized phage-associated protein
MAHRAVEIANAFLARPGAMGALTQMQLQKLVFIAHGWSLALTGNPLVSDQFEAWEFGPVSRDLYEHTKYFGRFTIDRLIRPGDDIAATFFLNGDRQARGEPYQAHLTASEAEMVSRVFRRYGRLSGQALSRLTHQPGTPWNAAYRRGRNSRIEDHAIEQHYRSLAEDAPKAARH